MLIASTVLRCSKRPGCVDAARDELVARSLDVGADQEQALRRTGRGRRELLIEELEAWAFI